MASRDEAWPEGTPCWVEIAVDDTDAAAAFYSGLFGWDVEDGTCRLAGRAVAGIGSRRPDLPAGWLTFLASGHADASADEIALSGGTVLVAPFDVPERARAVIAVDPAGAVFGVWQARGHVGFEVANEVGTVCWNEHLGPAAEAAKAFYATAFAHTFAPADDPVPYAADYAMTSLHGRVVGGLASTPGEPARWASHVLVADCDAATTAVTDLGGTVRTAPMATAYGRIAVVADDQGVEFTVIAGTP